MVKRESGERHTSNITLWQGDCLKLMKDIPAGSVDLVLTDPPYGIDYQSQWRKDKAQWKPKIKNDKSPFVDFVPQLKRVMSHSGAAMIFTRWDVQQQFIDALTTSGLSVKNILIWDKVIHGMGDLKRAYGSRYESIIFCANSGFRFNGKRPTDIVRFQRVSANKLIHPNEKPTELLETLVTQCTRQGQNVLDPFFGSGSTGVACVNTGRNFIGIELDPTYFDIAQKRIAEAQRR